MGSPLAHWLVALSLFILIRFRSKITRKDLLSVSLFLFLSILPDIDHFTFVDGKIAFTQLYHHGFTHSIGFALFVGVMFASAYYIVEYFNYNSYNLFNFKKRSMSGLYIFFIITLVVFSHDIVDYYTEDSDDPPTGNGIGLLMFYPFTDRYLISDEPFLDGIDKTNFFNEKNFRSINEEFNIFFPPLGVAYISGIVYRRFYGD